MYFIQDGELFLQKRRLSKDPVLTPVKSEAPLSDREYFDQVGWLVSGPGRMAGFCSNAGN